MKALLLSGGMDSIALAYWLRPEIAITVDYGQRAAQAELNAAMQVAGQLGLQHEVITIDCRAIGSGDMGDRSALDMAPAPEWWPFRNQLLITFAAARGIALGVTEIMTGSVASDGVHADGRPGFYAAMDAVTAIQEGSIRVTAPALSLTTADLIKQSGIPRELLSWAHSCHVSNLACGQCRGCAKHFHVTQEVYGVGY